MSESAYGFKESVKNLPRNLRESVIRRKGGTPEQKGAATVFGNLFLHMHPVRVQRNSLRLGYTFGLGLISFYLFLLLVVSGILVMFYYTPSTQLAYRNMKDLEYVVTFGVVLRNVHRWSAHAMVAVAFLHMCRVFYTGSYKAPREFNWVIGVCLLILTLLLSFTGYLLPWDQLAFWAVTVGSNIAAYMPWIGESVRFLMPLLRFYVLHVALLPVIAAVLMGVHFWRIRKDGGLSGPPKDGNSAQAAAGSEEEQPCR